MRYVLNVLWIDSMIVNMYGECCGRNFKDKFLVVILIVYVLMYGSCIGSYPIALITIQSKVEKGEVYSERSVKSYFRGFTLAKMLMD